MTRDTYLPGEYHILPNLRAACQAYLCTEQRVLPDQRPMTNLDQVIDLRTSPNAGFTDRGAVNRCVSLNLYVVFQDDPAGLGYFLITSLTRLGKAKTIPTDDDAVLQMDPVADLGILSNGDMGVGYKIAADADAPIDRDMGVQHSVVTQFDALVDETKGPDAWISAKADIFGNHG